MLAAGAFLSPGWRCHLLLVQTVFPGPFLFRFLTRRGPEKASFYPHVLEGLLGEVGFTSLSKELAWHLRRDLWPRDPGTVRDARGGKDGGPGCRLGLAGAGAGGSPGLGLSPETSRAQGAAPVPSPAAGRPCPPWGAPRAWCPGQGARSTVCALDGAATVGSRGGHVVMGRRDRGPLWGVKTPCERVPGRALP